jgi:hypothetical protein
VFFLPFWVVDLVMAALLIVECRRAPMVGGLLRLHSDVSPKFSARGFHHSRLGRRPTESFDPGREGNARSH